VDNSPQILAEKGFAAANVLAKSNDEIHPQWAE